MKKISFLVLLFITISLSAQRTIQWRGDRTGVYKETGLLKSWAAAGPAMLWHFEGLGEGHSSIAIDNEKIFVTGMTDDMGYLYMLDMNGKLLRKKEYGSEWSVNYSGSRGTVTADSGKLYIVSGTGNIICLDQNSLTILWQKNFREDFGGDNTKHGINESPLIVGDKLIVSPGGKKYNIVALNKNTGVLIWSSEGEGDLSGYCSPIYVSDQQVPQVITMMANHIIGVDVANGKKLWSFENKNRFSEHPNTPVYGDGMVLCTSSYGKGSVMLRLIDGGRAIEKAWDSAELDTKTGHMLKLGKYVYGSGDKAFWYCVDWQTGKQMYKDNSLATGNIIAADGMLYCYSNKGDMALVKAGAEKFEVVSKFPITLGTAQHWAHPVIYKGVLYVRHGDSLMAYKIK